MKEIKRNHSGWFNFIRNLSAIFSIDEDEDNETDIIYDTSYVDWCRIHGSLPKKISYCDCIYGDCEPELNEGCFCQRRGKMIKE